MKRMLIMLIVLAAVLSAFAVVSADQNGNDTWCNADAYGCYVNTKDDLGYPIRSYIQFWSAEAREYIMGDSKDELIAPKPSNVTDKMYLKVQRGEHWYKYNNGGLHSYNEFDGEGEGWTWQYKDGKISYGWQYRGDLACNLVVDSNGSRVECR